MFCNNCGAELKEGTLICERCGARQSAGGNGGNGNTNGKKSSGGHGGHNLGKILAAVIGVCVIVGGIIFAVTKFNFNNSSIYTHNIDFNKDNLTISDENTLRYRDISVNQTFTVGSENGFVDITLVDEAGSKADFVINKTEKDDRYIIKPQTVWDTTHTYFLTLNENTYFTDEDMNKFKKLIFTTKQEKACEYNINQEIKDYIENTESEIETKVQDGDIVLKKDTKGNVICRKVKKDGTGVVTYEEPALNEIFVDMKLHDNFTPDYNKIVWNDNIGKKVAYNVSHSEFFDMLVQTVYASELEAFSYTEVIEFLRDYVTCKPYTMKNGLGAKVIITFPKLDQLVFDSIKVDGGMEITIDVSNSFEFIPTFDFTDDNNVRFDMQFYTHPASTFNVTINGESNITDDAVKAAWDAIDDYDAVVPICDVPIPIPGTYLNAGVIKGGIRVHVPMGFVPKFSSKIDFAYNHERASTIKFGLSLVDGEFKYDYLNDLVKDNINIDASGEMYASIGFRMEPQVTFEISANADIIAAEAHGTAVASVGFGAEVGPYVDFKGQFKGEWDKVNKTKNIDGNCDLELGVYYELDINGYLTINVGYSVINLKDTAKNAGKSIGAKMGNFFLGEGTFEESDSIRSMDETTLVDIDEHIAFVIVDDKLPLLQIGGYINNDGADIGTSINVGGVGSNLAFGPYSFKVLDKDEKSGLALIVSEDGIDCKRYNEEKDSSNISISYTWADSDLRKYLNEEFIKKFDAVSQGAISQTKVKAEGNSKYNITGGADSNDNVFILSKSELEKYLSSDSQRQLKASGAALASGAYVCDEDDPSRNRKAGNTIYWVRNPGNATYNVMAVNSDGSINEEGASFSRADVCFRPAMWIRYIKKGEKTSDRLEYANRYAIQ